MFKDRVYETSTSTGSGAFTLVGAAAGFRSFSAAFGNGVSAYYAIVNRDAPAQWEIGSYTVNGATLSRVAGSVLSGSAGAGVLVNFSAGTKDVYNVIPASSILPVDQLLHTVRGITYVDNQVANCGGMIPNGNCYGNGNWTMPDGNWWTWGLGLGYANPSGFDGAGGYTTVNQPVATINSPIQGAYYLHHAEVGFDVYWRNVNNCNCGATNCYNNCNCNCACACNCGADD